MHNKIKNMLIPAKPLHSDFSKCTIKNHSDPSRLLSMKRLDQLSIELLAIQSMTNFDLFNFSVPEYADNLMFYIGE
ncbi:MAG: hypothetical protein ACFFD1_13955, partial [Candidatus Thorarchaeota archaeon]